MGDAGPDRQCSAVTAVAAQCGVEVSEDEARALLTRTIGAETQTFSGARSPLAEYWTPRAEELFRGAGLDRLNALFQDQSPLIGRSDRAGRQMPALLHIDEHITNKGLRRGLRLRSSP